MRFINGLFKLHYAPRHYATECNEIVMNCASALFFHWSRFYFAESSEIFEWDNILSSVIVPYSVKPPESSKMQRVFCASLVLVVLGPTFSQDIFELTTRLDDPRFRFLFHGFRSFVFNSIGKTGQKTKGVFLQDKFPDAAAFPCDVSIGKSKVRPSSIHKLRPGGNLFWPDDYISLSSFYSNTLRAC